MRSCPLKEPRSHCLEVPSRRGRLQGLKGEAERRAWGPKGLRWTIPVVVVGRSTLDLCGYLTSAVQLSYWNPRT